MYSLTHHVRRYLGRNLKWRFEVKVKGSEVIAHCKRFHDGKKEKMIADMKTYYNLTLFLHKDYLLYQRHLRDDANEWVNGEVFYDPMIKMVYPKDAWRDIRPQSIGVLPP
jgi:hypothetical protein